MFVPQLQIYIDNQPMGGLEEITSERLGGRVGFACEGTGGYQNW